MPEPVPNPETGEALAYVGRSDGSGEAPVRLHRWVASLPVPREPGRSRSRPLGRTESRHGARAGAATDHTRPLHGRVGLTTADVWPDLVARSSAARAPWAEELAAAEDLARRASELLAPWDPADEILCHGDVDQKNLLVAPGGPLLGDWDVVLPRLPAHDLAEAAMSMARWRAPDVAAAVLEGYREAGGTVDRFVPSDLGPSLASRLGSIRFSIDRALAAGADSRQLADGPDVSDLLIDLEQRLGVAESVRDRLGQDWSPSSSESGNGLRYMRLHVCRVLTPRALSRVSRSPPRA